MIPRRSRRLIAAAAASLLILFALPLIKINSTRTILNISAVPSYSPIKSTPASYTVHEATKLCPNRTFQDDEISYFPSQGRNDAWIMYRIHDYVYRSSCSHNYAHVCIATQGSLHKLQSIPEVTEHWNGPMSIAVFAPGIDWTLAVKYINHLRKCFPKVAENINFHFVYPISHSAIFSDFQIPELGDCSVDPKVLLEKLLSYRNESFEELLFPQNHLRNVARKTCLTPNVFMTDIDIIPSYGMYEELSTFLRNDKCKDCINVIPTFELKDGEKFPRSKSELNKLVKKKRARYFHQKIAKVSHGGTDYSRWLRDSSQGPVQIAYDIPTPEFRYEPFYVSSDKVPQHDERFIGYGYTRNTQVYEMVQMGYPFRVLTPIFTIHWGFHTPKEHTSWRKQQNWDNSMLVKDFKDEVAIKVKTFGIKTSKKDS